MLEFHFDVGLIQLSFHANACKGVFNPNVTIFPSNCAKGLYISAFFIIRVLKHTHYINVHVH